MLVDFERRSRARFPLQLEVKFTAQRTTPCFSGAGRTVNISSTGFLIASEQRIPAGTWLDVTLEWPWLLDGVTPLQLAARCMVVRSNASGFAVLLASHQFRTRRRSREPISPIAGEDNLKKAASA
jgi:hypothetical protein